MSGDWHEDEQTPARRRPWRWVLMAGMLLVLAGAGFYLTWTKRSEQRLNQLVEELKGAGEPVEPAEMVHRPIPAEDDAALDLQAAVALFKGIDKSNIGDTFDFGSPLSAKEAATLAEMIERERGAVDRVRGARGKTDADWKIPYQSPTLMTLLPHLNPQRALGQLCRAAAVNDRLKGDDFEVVEHLRDVLAIGRANETQPIMVAHLVAVGVTAVACEQLGRFAPDLAVGSPSRPGGRAATPEQVRATIGELLDEAPCDAGVHAAFAGERVMMLDTMKLLADRKLDAASLMGTVGAARGMRLPVPRGIIFADAVIIVTQDTQVAEAFARSPDYVTYRQNAPPAPAALQKNPKVHFLAGSMLPSYDRFILQQYRIKADRRLTATALALRLYAAEHAGKYPATLDALVPKYLPSVPKDPFAAGDKPLHYSLTDPAVPRVYSVADNGIDDGGSTSPTNYRRNDMGRWEKGDAVLEMRPFRLLKTAEEEKKADAEESAR
jgi:hypothetical protein